MAAHSLSAGVVDAEVPWFVVEAVTRARITTDMEELVSEGLRLGAHFARPAGVTRVPGIARAAGLSAGRGGAAAVGNTDQTLCDRIARESGWAGLTFTFRGTGPSEGDFSIEGWLADVRAAVDALHARTDITGVWIAGFRLGGTLAILVAADDERVRGIATFAAPASLRTWVREPEWFLEYARRTGVLRTPEYPPDPEAWIRAIANLDPIAAAERIAPRPWLARARQRRRRGAGRRTRADLREAGGDGVDLRIVANGPHRLRHDPRAIAALLGWLDRQEP